MTSTSTTDGGWVPPYTSITQLISSSGPLYPQEYPPAATWTSTVGESFKNYKPKIEAELSRESPIMELLKQQTEKAWRAMARDLEQQLLYGSSTTMKRNEGLRQLIADAYDEHMPKEAEVSTEDIVRKAVDKKKEERAENLVEYMTGFFDNGEFEDGDTIGWTCRFRNNEKVYRYSAIKSGGMWYITNRNGSFDDMEMVKIITTLAIDGTVVLSGDEEPL